MEDPELIIATLNIQGQSGFSETKQKQIEHLIQYHQIDIIHCQEIEITSSTFKSCKYISSNYNIIENNSPVNKYGTATLVRNNLIVENIKCDTNGRAIVFTVGNVTFSNFYLPSGNSGQMREERTNYFSEIIPQLLVNKKDAGVLGADFNCIIEKQDALRNQEQKMSPALQRLVKVFSLKDSFRQLFPYAKTFSRYYSSEHGGGATRIDRFYNYGDVSIIDAQYLGVSFSDHHCLLLKIKLPDPFSRLISPKSRMPFKANPQVVKDEIFKSRLKDKFNGWKEGKCNMEFMVWWEEVVKPGVKRLLLERGKEMKSESRGQLNLLLVRQAYLVGKLHRGEFERLEELKYVQNKINEWYSMENEKIKIQSKMEDFVESEKVRIYHHELHQRQIRKSSILKLDTPDEHLSGHKECAKFLEENVARILTGPPDVDSHAQDILLQEVDKVFTDNDNDALLEIPTKEEILKDFKKLSPSRSTRN